MSWSEHNPVATPRWRVEFSDGAELARELQAQLSRGGWFLAGGSGVVKGDEVDVVLVHPGDGDELVIPSVVVWVAEGDAGVGVAFRDYGPGLRDALAEFAARPTPAEPTPSRASDDRLARNVNERLRGLNPSEQMKVALSGEVNERVVLERLYGKAVWEPLLRNPRLTIAEVVRLARMGNLPRPQVETIAANPAWLNAPEVRRALLTNRRLSGVLIQKVLKAMPKSELRLATKQTIYPAAVRDAAIKLLKT